MGIKEKRNKSIDYRRRIALTYILLALVGGLLLFSPFTTKNGQDINLIDAFFVAASALSDTGLSPISTADVFNNFGQVILLVLIMVGGIGIMSVKVGLFVFIGKKINVASRMLIYTEQGLTNRAGIVKLIKDSILIIIATEIIFAIIIMFHMMVKYDYDILHALWFGIFHSISAINNAGFDLTGQSLIPFDQDYLFQTYMMLLIIIGGIGFPVLVDIKNYLGARKENKSYRFSLFTKISLTTYFTLIIVGCLLILICDYNFIFVETGGIKGFFYALFQTVSARNAGFSTVSLTEFNTNSQMVLSLLMFIGASPASTGGGIRTTTLAILFLYIRAFATNVKDVNAFHRRLSKENIFNAFITLLISSILFIVATFLVVLFDHDTDVMKIIFEVASAFGTTGLTMDYTPHLNDASKIVLACVMVIGQMGITNLLFLISRNKEHQDKIRYPEENIIVG
ncbi:MAG: potassium transporter TrkG [Erysipelotrichales bacterium]